MPLVVKDLEARFKVVLDKNSDVKVDPAEARATLAKDLADAVHLYLKSAVVNASGSNGGGPVTVIGSLS